MISIPKSNDAYTLWVMLALVGVIWLIVRLQNR